MYSYLSEDSSDEEISDVVMVPRRVRIIRIRPNHFNEWDDIDFRTRFRVTKQSAYVLLELIGSQIQHITNWNNAVIAETMLLLTLRIYATGSMLITAGDFSGVSKSTACRIVAKVSHFLALLRPYFISLPRDSEEINTTKYAFYGLAKFPNVIGAIDCTHVKILSPGGNSAEIFRNRKGFFSYNVQTICDANLKILDIVARWPGSTHDATIFDNSKACARLESNEFFDNYIVADSGYANRNYILTCLANVNLPEENLYNESLIRTRNCVERSYGAWKRRFPILSTGLRFKALKNQSIIVATAVLHNICIMENDVESPPLEESLETAVNVVLNVPSNNDARNNDNNLNRSLLVNDCFKNML